MKRQEILTTMEQLAKKSKFYGRKLKELREEEKENPDEYENDMRILESKNLKDVQDLKKVFEE